MTTEDKLQHFTSVTIENVQKECDKVVTEYKEKMDKYFEEHKDAAIKKARLATSIAEDGIKRKASQEYTSVQMHLKRKINHKQVELKDKLFGQVKELLSEYVKTDEYRNYVLEKIESIKKFAGSDELVIVLDPKDAKLADEISPSSTIKVTVGEKSFIGGVVGQIPSKNILIDDSFESKYEEIKEKYTIGGGR